MAQPNNNYNQKHFKDLVDERNFFNTDTCIDQHTIDDQDFKISD